MDSSEQRNMPLPLQVHELRIPSSLASTPSNSDESLLLDLDIGTVRYKRPNKFAVFLARFPYLVALMAGIFGGVCGLALHFKPFPDFGNNVLVGFEARSTHISSRSETQALLHRLTGAGKPYSTRASMPTWELTLPGRKNERRTRSIGHRNKRARGDMQVVDHRRTEIRYDPQKCGGKRIDPVNFKVVFQSNNGRDLFTLEAFQAICDIETAHLMSTPSSECPRMHSLPFYTSVKFRRSCRRLTQEDVGNMKAFLRRCYPYYTKKTLKDDCITNTCQAPPECVEHNAAYKIFYYLTDIGFICNGTETCDRLTYTTLFYNFKPEPVLEYYTKTFQGKDLSNDYVRVTAVYQSESLKDKLFQTYLIGDLKYFAVALGMILLILIVYMRSVVLVIALMGNVAASFVAAYAVYFYVFRIEFFPFINIISGLILIAIGADNVFVFYDAWKEAKKSDRNIPLENQVSRTFSHAAVAITVTSLTTSASFYANCVTHIPAIRCFGIFAGTAILANYIFMMTWTPAVVVMVEKLDRMCLSRCSCWEKSNKFLGRVADVVCSKGVSVLIEKLWPLWLLLFMSLGVAGLIVVFISPGLRLPTSREFQLYPTSQPLEYWDQVVRKRFQFYLDYISGDQDEVPLNYIWGMVPVDNRKWDNTSDMGYLVEDASFDIFSHEAQLWLKGFARQATNQSSVRGFHGQKVLSTFEALETVLTDHCGGSTQLDKTLSRYITACCHNRSMPFSRQYLEVCFAPVYMATLMAIEPNRVIGKPLFNKSNALKALIIELPTNSHYSTSYEEMDTMYSLRETFFTSQLSTAPKGLQNGFMSGYGWFNFYDLQRAISHGTYYSIVLSLGVATILMLLTSLNLLVTLYAMVTITFAIAVTIGVLVLLGWHLNIIESITISLAVGLSIDFTIHYGVTYRLSKEQQPFLRVREGFARVGSAVAMAALTTFVAGAAVMPAHILAYSKLGMFLMLVMSISWAYATFFFQSLCRIIGPRGKFCQIPLRCGKKKVEVDSDLQLPNQVLYRQREVEPFSFNNVMDPIDDDDNLLHPF